MTNDTGYRLGLLRRKVATVKIPPIARPRKWATYNVGSRSDRRVFKDILRLIMMGCVHIGLNEVGDRTKVLSAIQAATGYQLVRGDGEEPGSAKIAALVHPDAEITGIRLTKISERTKVGRRTAGARRTGWTAAKFILTVWFVDDDDRCVGGTTHLTPSAMKKGNKVTKRLHRVQVSACANWIIARRRYVAVLAGDLNAALNKDNERDELLGPLDRVAILYSAPTFKKRWIDIFAVAKTMSGSVRRPRRGAQKGLRGAVRRVLGLSSDHKALVFTEGTP